MTLEPNLAKIHIFFWAPLIYDASNFTLFSCCSCNHQHSQTFLIQLKWTLIPPVAGTCCSSPVLLMPFRPVATSWSQKKFSRVREFAYESTNNSNEKLIYENRDNFTERTSSLSFEAKWKCRLDVDLQQPCSSSGLLIMTDGTLQRTERPLLIQTSKYQPVIALFLKGSLKPGSR